MDKCAPTHTTPAASIDIENRIIDKYLSHIGVYGFAVYSLIERHLSQETHHGPPSYATIARKIGIDQGAVIRHVKKLQRLHLLSPTLRFKEDEAGLRRRDRRKRCPYKRALPECEASDEP